MNIKSNYNEENNMRKITEKYNSMDNKISLRYQSNNETSKRSRRSSSASEGLPQAPLLTQKQQQQQKQQLIVLSKCAISN